MIKGINNHLPKYIVPGLLINPFNRIEVDFKLNNMETKKVTLNNGTELEVGKKYRQSCWTKEYFEVLCKGNYAYFGIMYFEEGNKEDRLFGILDSCIWLPYIEPTTQKDWKTFMIETLSQKTDVPYRFFSQYYSMEDAREHHKRAISIMEVKLNIELVNS